MNGYFDAGELELQMCGDNGEMPTINGRRTRSRTIGCMPPKIEILKSLLMSIEFSSSSSVTFPINSVLCGQGTDGFHANIWCCLGAVKDHRNALNPLESALVDGASSRRIAEFSTGRYCARRALDRFGCEDSPILADQYGAPLWPSGYIGSISHCSDFAVAAVGRSSMLNYFGVDIEDAIDIDTKVIATLSSSDELENVARLSRESSPYFWNTVLFSAKESVFKAVFCATQFPAKPRDISIHINADGIFYAACNVGGIMMPKPLRLEGRWLEWKQHILTMTWLKP